MTHPSELDGWAVELTRALGIEELDVPIQLVLDLARDAAHGVARPAAPLTTFLVGYAAAKRGGDPAADIAELAGIASRLATERGAP
jgi:hypothetical protein